MGRLFPQCALCRVERVSIALEPIAKRYDVRSLECPCCETVVRLVERRQGGRRLPCSIDKRSAGGFAARATVLPMT
jgi:hypothetical protein